MNTDLLTQPSAGNGHAPDLPESAQSLPPADPDQHRRDGKIAHFTKQQRDLIHHLFDEGVTYEAICKRLAEEGVSLNVKNLSDWYHGGYQDELKARERRLPFR